MSFNYVIFNFSSLKLSILNVLLSSLELIYGGGGGVTTQNDKKVYGWHGNDTAHPTGYPVV